MHTNSKLRITHTSQTSVTVDWKSTSYGNTTARLWDRTLGAEVGNNILPSHERTTQWTGLTAGHEYRTEISSTSPMAQNFHAVFSKAELGILLERASNYVTEQGNVDEPCEYLYHTEPDQYFDYIDCRSDMMETSTVDHMGHAACAINGQLMGLVFTNSASFSSRPKTKDYTLKQLKVPLSHIFSSDTNLYFCDFYCMDGEHVTLLVLTKKFSPSDMFCEQHMLPLNAENNPFIKRGYKQTEGVLIQIYYTEPLNKSYCRGPDDVYTSSLEHHSNEQTAATCFLCRV